jgi:hypothetical protein
MIEKFPVSKADLVQDQIDVDVHCRFLDGKKNNKLMGQYFEFKLELA